NEGLNALEANWLGRAIGREETAAFPDGGKTQFGKVKAIESGGDLVVECETGELKLALAPSLLGSNNSENESPAS
ncbi:MAG: hypothetical protein R3245_06555, partial [Kiloniellales bacterium]|nr:hypothetical protein [Kiloniellales bacterium]